MRTWATALRVPTAEGPVWFKANTPELRHEVAVVERVSARVPDRVPPLLASDVERGWMLMADAGERLREVVVEERSLARWHDVLAGAADVALALEPDVDDLVGRRGAGPAADSGWPTATPSWCSGSRSSRGSATRSGWVA